jgi:hypothetical protein
MSLSKPKRRAVLQEGMDSSLLGADALSLIFTFVGAGNYWSICDSKLWRATYLSKGYGKTTSVCESLEILILAVGKGYIVTPDTCDTLARRGNLTSLKWVHARSFIPPMCWRPSTCASAVSAGKNAVEILTWLCAAEDGPKCTMSTQTCSEAAFCGNLEALIWAMENRCYASKDVLISAVDGKQLDLLKWISKAAQSPFYSPTHHHMMLKLYRFRTYTSVGSAAAATGDMKLLEFLRSDGYCFTRTNGAAATRSAAGNGRLDVLKWLRQSMSYWDESVCTEAASGGYLEILQWACENGCPIDPLKCAIGASRGGHAKVLEWIQKNYDEGWRGDRVTRAAAEGGHLDVLIWLHEMECPAILSACVRVSAENGHIDTLEWSVRQGGRGTLTRNVAAGAAGGGHLEALQFLDDRGCKIDGSTCSAAARGGHLHVLKWLHEKMFLFCYDTFTLIAESGNLEALFWAHNCAGGFPEEFCQGICLAAVRGGNIDMIVTLANLLDFELDSRCAVAAASGGNLQILHFLVEMRCPGLDQCARAALDAGHLHVMRYLHSLDILKQPQEIVRRANQEILPWIRATYNLAC